MIITKLNLLKILLEISIEFLSDVILHGIAGLGNGLGKLLSHVKREVFDHGVNLREDIF